MTTPYKVPQIVLVLSEQILYSTSKGGWLCEGEQEDSDVLDTQFLMTLMACIKS